MTQTLRDARAASGKSLTAVAAEIGSSESHVGHVLAGRTDPKVSTVVKIARAVGLDGLADDLEALGTKAVS